MVEPVQRIVEKRAVSLYIGRRFDREHGNDVRGSKTLEHGFASHDGNGVARAFERFCAFEHLVSVNELELRARCVVALEASGRARCVAAGIGHRYTERSLELGARNDAVTKQTGFAGLEIEHCRLDPEFARAAIENQIELAFGFKAEIFGNVCRTRRTDAAERVG